MVMRCIGGKVAEGGGVGMEDGGGASRMEEEEEEEEEAMRTPSLGES